MSYNVEEIWVYRSLWSIIENLLVSKEVHFSTLGMAKVKVLYQKKVKFKWALSLSPLNLRKEGKFKFA